MILCKFSVYSIFGFSLRLLVVVTRSLKMFRLHSIPVLLLFSFQTFLTNAADPTATISKPEATLVGSASNNVDSFLSIPFAQAPVGPLRLKPPQPITSSLGTIQAKGSAPSCPQFFFDTNGNFPVGVLGKLADTPLFQKITDQSEDCLYINVYRPAGTTPSDSLPVLFWIYGGAFAAGGAAMYDGSSWVKDSVQEGQPIIFVTVAYRLGGFGFLPGKEIKADKSANLGLLDQRRGLEWVADNIASFGGDPSKVTIWGESAGAISVFDQSIAYDGDNTYNGKPLFRAGIMNSGSVVPADAVDGTKGQEIYDTVIKAAGCDTAADSLECLRGLDYDTFLNAVNSVPGLVNYNSVALSYLPRPDGIFLTDSPDILAINGKVAKVPVIIGDQEDEGTVFALFQSNIWTKQQLVSYLLDSFFFDANETIMTELVNFYDDIPSYGSPFRTWYYNNWYPQYMRLAAILGDLAFTLTRRETLGYLNGLGLNTWSYLSSYYYGTPILGTFHGSDILQVFNSVPPDYASRAFRMYYISFVNHLDPNVGTNGTYSSWPEWGQSKQLLNMFSGSSSLIADDFRQDVSDFLLENERSFYIRR